MKSKKCVQTIFFNIRGYIEMPVFEMTRAKSVYFQVLKFTENLDHFFVMNSCTITVYS